MKVESTIANGFSACAGMCDAGWYGAALVLDGRDKEFRTMPDDLSYGQCAAYARRWFELTVNPRRELRLVLPKNNQEMASQCIAAAERIEGPVAPREPVATPTLAWIEQRAGQWHLMLHEKTKIRTVLSRNEIMRCPQLAELADGLCFAFENDTGPATTEVQLVDSGGIVHYTTAGRNPVLRATGDGVVLATEQPTPDEVSLRLAFFDVSRLGAPAYVANLREGDYLLNADIAWSESQQACIVAAESSPRLGYSNQIGLHRTIPTWLWRPGTDAVPLGALPVEKRAFKSIGAENMAPIKPTVMIENGKPIVVFKQHRFTGFRAFGWDLFWCRRKDDGWTEPGRISPETTTSDSNFGLVYDDGQYIGLFPAHENEGGSGSKQSENHRVELVKFNRDYCLARYEVPGNKKADYRMPLSCRNVAPDPAPLANPYEGRQLVWGDVHIHTIYSKCVAAVDGSPRENIRFARDVLGCRVFAIAEHTPHTTGIESTWLYDQLESTAGRDNVILYATEPGIQGTRHMNFYSRDRETFEKLERIILAQGKRYPEILRQLREGLPSDSVFVMRHVHGDAIPDAQIAQHFDPHFEMAMEAMQGRGNAMLGVVETSPVFPNSFLDAGCKVGLVGGTDHFREWAPNHFCLTGFWVKEVSQKGVWEAIRNRYTIAMSDARVAMLTRCKGAPMGQTVTLAPDEPMRVRLQASCGHHIRRITLMRDGELLPWVGVDARSAVLELADETASPGYHWYVATAEVQTGYGGDNIGICHASPYFVWKQGKQQKG